MSIEIIMKKIRFALASSALCIALSALPLLSAQSNKPVSLKDTIPQLIPYPSPTFERKPTLRWHKPSPGFTKYYIQVSTSPAFTSTIVYVSPVDTFYTCEIDLPFDTIFWRIKTDISSWSTPGSFIVKDIRIPVPIPYENPTLEKKPVLKWRKPQAQIALYRIQISTDSLFTHLQADTNANDTFYMCSKELPLGTIYWKVKSDDSEFSRLSSFYLRDSRIPWLIPSMPKITYEIKPALRWYEVSGAGNYTLEIDNNDDFASTILSIPLTDTSFTPFENLPAGDIHWRVKSNLIDTWSLLDHFVIIPDSVPLLVLYNGETVTGARPAFKWHPVKNAVEYKIKLARNANFTNAKTDTLNDTAYTPDADLENGTWFWKVSCSRNINLFSPVDSFIVNKPIGVTTLTAVQKNRLSVYRLHGSVKIVLQEPYSNDVSARIYNARGRVVMTLKPVTTHKNSIFIWDYKDFSGLPATAGLYIISIKANDAFFTEKVIVNR